MPDTLNEGALDALDALAAEVASEETKEPEKNPGQPGEVTPATDLAGKKDVSADATDVKAVAKAPRRSRGKAPITPAEPSVPGRGIARKSDETRHDIARAVKEWTRGI